MSEAHVLDDLAGFALGILAAEEAARVAAHVAVCDSCRKELAALEATGAQIAMAASPVEPAASLKDLVLQRVGAASAGRAGAGTE